MSYDFYDKEFKYGLILQSREMNDIISLINRRAPLNSKDKIPVKYLPPGFIASIEEYDNIDKFPTNGSADIIYVAKDTGKSYRWGGTQYVEISASLALGEAEGTAYPGEKGKANADAIAKLLPLQELGEATDQVMSQAIVTLELNTKVASEVLDDMVSIYEADYEKLKEEGKLNNRTLYMILEDED